MTASVAFVTERLCVRQWVVGDAPDLYAMFSDPEVARWTSTPEPMTDLSQAVQKIADWNEPFDGHPALGRWAIVPTDTGRAEGSVLLRPLADSDEIEIGWSLVRRAWGNGWATEAAAGALDHAWAQGYPRVRAIMWPDNEASAAVCLRIGMIDLGVVHDPWHGTPQDPTSRMFLAERTG